MLNFDFILDNEPVTIDAPALPPSYVGPNLNEVVKMTRKKFGQDILEVYQKVGGADWLYNQALADPKAFFELLKKMIPNPTIADTIADITVKLINKYGETMEIEARSQTATSGSLEPQLIERYDDDNNDTS